VAHNHISIYKTGNPFRSVTDLKQDIQPSNHSHIYIEIQPVIYIFWIKAASYAVRMGKEVSTPASIECWNQVTSTDNIRGVNKTEGEVIRGFYKPDFRQARPAKS
jgi:hypothetical protein